jgi:gliding motility-associated-like protein
LNGNFWLLGGNQDNDSTGNPYEYDGLWKYDVTTGLWTWMNGPNPLAPPGVSIYGVQGVPSPQNFPANGHNSNHNLTWTDLQGNLWLFGAGEDAIGSVNLNGYPNDLWKYDIATNQWTWMHGPNTSGVLPSYGTLQTPSLVNLPPAPFESGSRWIDNDGNLWMYGSEYDAMWKFDISINQWIWMSGQSQGVTIPVNYGTKGVAAVSNTPGSRTIFTSFKDECGNFWFYDAYSPLGGFFGSEFTREMWMYNPSTYLWTWMVGDTVATSDYDPTFSQQCVPTDSLPGAYSWECRQAWTDKDYRFWMFSTYAGNSSELCMFDPVTLKFTWVAGALSTSSGVYGSQGIPATTNTPGSMLAACAFTAINGDLWLYGYATDPTTFQAINTLWRYQIDPNCPAPSSLTPISLGSDSSGCTPLSIQPVVTTPAGSSLHWDFGVGSTLADTSNQISPVYTYTTPGTYQITLTAETQSPLGCRVKDSVFATVIAQQTNLGNDTLLCGAQNLVLDPGGTGTYLWNTGETTPTITVNQSGLYTVQVSNSTLTCSDTIVVTINNGGGIEPINVFSPNSDGINDVFDVGNPAPENYQLEIFNRWGAVVFSSTDPTKNWDGTHNQQRAGEGVYYWIANYQDCDGKLQSRSGFVHIVK